jgi:glycosyltransferase involved in cell wall biosynthesis
MKPELAIVNIYQLGYHTDTYNYCLYLRDDFKITYISFHQGFENIVIEGIDTIYITQRRGFWNLIKGYIQFAKLLRQIKPDIIFLFYARFISIVKVFGPRCPYIFDIRTGFLKNKTYARRIWNLLLWVESLFFKSITIISEGLRKQLNIPFRKSNLLPLGGDVINDTKEFSNLNLIYIGTFDQREIHVTIEGVALFKKKYPDVPLHYDIVGYGTDIVEQQIGTAISSLTLDHEITFHGRVPYDKIDIFLRNANLGIVYIPMTPYYDNQPSTKLFEFLLAGMPVIATNTSSNRSIISDLNGILIDDNADGFLKGLEHVYKRRRIYDSVSIRNSVSEFSWEEIVKRHLKPLLYNLLRG